MRRYQGRFSGRDAACAIGIDAVAPGDARPAARSGAAAPESGEPPAILFRTRDLSGRDTDRALAVPRGC